MDIPQDVYISYAFGTGHVMRSYNGRSQMALNNRNLSQDAMSAIEPELRRRWNAYWDNVVERASIVRDADVKALTKMISPPSDQYPCPPDIAVRAIWPTAQAKSFWQVESGQRGE